MSLEVRDTKYRDIIAVEILKKNFSVRYSLFIVIILKLQWATRIKSNQGDDASFLILKIQL